MIMSQLNNELNGASKAQTVRVNDLAQYQEREADLQSNLELVEIRLTQGLQRSLEIETLLGFFCREVANIVPCDSVGYQNSQHRIAHAYGKIGLHICKYELTLEGEHLGDLICTRDKPFGDLDLLTIETLTGTLIYPLRNALLYQQAMSMALQDPLTGVGNRKALNKALNRESNISRRHDQPFSVMMIDIDYFKKINDSYGHSAGDQALTHVTNIISAISRQTDELFRYGGEEFVMILNNTDQAEAHEMAERIRIAIADSEVATRDNQFSLTVSIGIAQYDPINGAESIIDCADIALYKAKEFGRNQVQLAS